MDEFDCVRFRQHSAVYFVTVRDFCVNGEKMRLSLDFFWESGSNPCSEWPFRPLGAILTTFHKINPPAHKQHGCAFSSDLPMLRTTILIPNPEMFPGNGFYNESHDNWNLSYY